MIGSCAPCASTRGPGVNSNTAASMVGQPCSSGALIKEINDYALISCHADCQGKGNQTGVIRATCSTPGMSATLPLGLLPACPSSNRNHFLCVASGFLGEMGLVSLGKPKAMADSPFAIVMGSMSKSGSTVFARYGSMFSKTTTSVRS